MKIRNLRQYVSPRMEVHVVELEEGIAANSSNIRGGSGTTNPDTPVIDGWDGDGTPGQSQSRDFDL